MSWIRSAITDETGAYDVAYVSLFGVGSAVIGAIPFMCVMGWLAWLRCTPFIPGAGDPRPPVMCTFDPQPLGIAIGAACGGFATAVGGLAAYMLATRKPKG